MSRRGLLAVCLLLLASCKRNPPAVADAGTDAGTAASVVGADAGTLAQGSEDAGPSASVKRPDDAVAEVHPLAVCDAKEGAPLDAA
ncbi:hypothetical protein ACLEQD_22910, partial [Corallococcus sp. 4LFB]